jgi:hypothetical protein
LTISSLGLLSCEFISSSAASNLGTIEQKISNLCSRGEYSQAYKQLFPGTPAPINELTLDNLASLHPPRSETF